MITSLGLLAVLGGTVVAVAPAAAADPNPLVTINGTDTQAQIIAKAASVTPSARQLAWQREELTGFIHFGPNTFTGREWGSGAEDPNVFNPTSLDTDQWAATFKNAGFKKVIIVAKHHDGMLMFPSAYSSHGVASSSWQSGKGDVLKSFTDSARKYGLKVGVYLSPADGAELPHAWHDEWVKRIIAKHDAGQPLTTEEQSTYDDRNRTPGGQGRYGNGSAAAPTRIPSIGDGNGTTFNFTADDYNRYYMNTLYEVLTKYGTLDELWFDGANPWASEGLTQNYNFKDWFAMVRKLQPSAVMFGPDIRWVGNEAGLTTRTSEWSVVPQKGSPDPDGPRDPTFGLQSDDIAGDGKLTTESNYLAWHPAECDGRLQGEHWFWNQSAQASSLDTLKSMYLNSVGKNCQLLLNIAPDNTGRFPADAVTRMKEFGDWIASTRQRTAEATASNDTGTSNTSGNDPAKAVDLDDATAWQPTGTTGNLVLDFGSPQTFNLVNVQENIQIGQRVSGFAIDTWDGSSWQQITTGTTVGFRRQLKLANPVTTNKLRLRITASRALPPAIASFSIHRDGITEGNLALGKPATQSGTSYGASASRAVDGSTNGNFGAGSVTHTSDSPLGNNPWWQVDLGSSQQVGSVKLWNRTDCCSDRLRNFYVFTSDTPFTSTDPETTKQQPGVWSSFQSAAAGQSLSLQAGRTARYVRVQLVGSDRPLSLAEVEVFR